MALERSLHPRISGDIFPLILLPMVIICGLLVFLSLTWKTSLVTKWTMATAIIFLGQLFLVYFIRSSLNDRDEKHPTIALGRADTITLARGFLLACLSGAFYQHPQTARAVGLGTRVALPAGFHRERVLDGYVARKLKRPTAFGRVLDLGSPCLGDLAGHDPGFYLPTGSGLVPFCRTRPLPVHYRDLGAGVRGLRFTPCP